MTQSVSPVCATFRPTITQYGRPVRVEPVPDARWPVAEYLDALSGGQKIEHCGLAEMVLPPSPEDGGRSPTCLFFQAVHACFAGHHALTLRPEVLMHLIVSQVARTVNLHPEDYCNLFTASGKKVEVRVRHDGLQLGNRNSPWGEAIALFDGALRERVPAGIMDHMLPPFSTATGESRVASLLAFMDAAQSYYQYVVETRCGIPEIRLAGTADDYHRLLNAASQLAEPFSAHLGPYFASLLPVLKTLADQAAGEPVDEEFWKSAYKWNSDSGTPVFNGWLTAFVNYILVERRVVAKPAHLFDWTTLVKQLGGFGTVGLDHGCVPASVSSVPFIWDYLSHQIPMRFMGGVLAIVNSGDSLMPQLSYAVLHDK